MGAGRGCEPPRPPPSLCCSIARTCEADSSSWLIHPDIDEARVGVEAVAKSIHDIDKAIRNLNNVWVHLRNFEMTQSAVAGSIASKPLHTSLGISRTEAIWAAEAQAQLFG